MHPRPDNGTEDAHDYLWLTQDLWMEPDVWEWVNENPDVKNAVLQYCDKCFVRETKVAEFKRCSACRIVCLRKWYFSLAKTDIFPLSQGTILWSPMSEERLGCAQTRYV